MEEKGAAAEEEKEEKEEDIGGQWKCGICGRMNDDESAKCSTCGAKPGRKPNPNIVNYEPPPDRYAAISFMASRMVDNVTMAAATHISTHFPASREAPAVLVTPPPPPIPLTRRQKSDPVAIWGSKDATPPPPPSLQKQHSYEEPALSGRDLYKKALESFGALTLEPKGDDGPADLLPFAAPCAVCRKMCPYRCSRCHSVFYCSREHQRSHWGEHQATCMPISEPPYVWKVPKPAPNAQKHSGRATALRNETAMARIQAEDARDRANACGYEESQQADECPCCYEAYQRGPHVLNTSMRPRTLPCGDVSCTGCLSRMIVYGKVKCPVCMRQFDCERIEDMPIHTNALDNNLGTIDEKGGDEEMEMQDMSRNGGAGGDGNPQEAFNDADLIQLVEMGFDEVTAKNALRVAHGNLENAAIYCMDPESMPSATTYGPHLPGSSSGGYAADADEGDEESGAAVHPLQNRGNDGDSRKRRNAAGGDPNFMSSDVRILMDMGIPKEQAQQALKHNGYNRERALDYIFGTGMSEENNHAGDRAAADDGPAKRVRGYAPAATEMNPMHYNGSSRAGLDDLPLSLPNETFRDKETHEKNKKLAKDFQSAFKQYKSFYKAQGHPDATKMAMARAREDFPDGTEVEDKRLRERQEEAAKTQDPSMEEAN